MFVTCTERSHARGGEQGIALVTVLVIMAISLLIGGGLLAVGTYQLQFAKGREHNLQALYLAEAGAERALALLQECRGIQGPVIIEGELGSGTYRTRIEHSASNTVITSTGYLSNSDTYRTIEVTVKKANLAPISWVELPGEQVQ